MTGRAADTAATTSAQTTTAAPTVTTPSGLPLKQVADVPLPGGASRFDYQSVDPSRRRLFIAHMGDGHVVVVDLARRRVVKDIANTPDAHGVLVVPKLRRLYVAATARAELVTFDERTFREVHRAPAGSYPDGIAYDPRRRAGLRLGRARKPGEGLPCAHRRARRLGRAAFRRGQRPVRRTVGADPRRRRVAKNVLAVIDPRRRKDRPAGRATGLRPRTRAPSRLRPPTRLRRLRGEREAAARRPEDDARPSEPVGRRRSGRSRLRRGTRGASTSPRRAASCPSSRRKSSPDEDRRGKARGQRALGGRRSPHAPRLLPARGRRRKARPADHAADRRRPRGPSPSLAPRWRRRRRQSSAASRPCR